MRRSKRLGLAVTSYGVAHQPRDSADKLSESAPGLGPQVRLGHRRSRLGWMLRNDGPGGIGGGRQDALRAPSPSVRA